LFYKSRVDRPEAGAADERGAHVGADVGVIVERVPATPVPEAAGRHQLVVQVGTGKKSEEVVVTFGYVFELSSLSKMQ
jgi:hypothetical protein